ncbi:hypothetical protein CcaCcLH18_13838 [Colletotrichum camelliae]|nr:hypothetical protein CcaCcLH18_13838 [Colletotrichum camelliae]
MDTSHPVPSPKGCPGAKDRSLVRQSWNTSANRLKFARSGTAGCPQYLLGLLCEEPLAPAIEPDVIGNRLEKVTVLQNNASSNGDAELPASKPVKLPETKFEEPTVDPDPEFTAKKIAEEDIKGPKKPIDPSRSHHYGPSRRRRVVSFMVRGHGIVQVALVEVFGFCAQC